MAERASVGYQNKGLAIPKNENPIVRGYIYKQEVNSSESRPKVSKWEKVFCSLYTNVLVYYRTKESSKPLDMLSLDADFLLKKVRIDDDNKKLSFKKKYLFLLTDLEHVHHYFAVGTSALRVKWVETIQNVLNFHYKSKKDTERSKKLQKSYKEQIRALKEVSRVNGQGRHRRGQVGYIQGLGMERSERKLFDEENERLISSIEDLELRKDGWKEEALRLRKEVEELKRFKKKEVSARELDRKHFRKFADEIEKSGYERDLCKVKEYEQKSKIRELRKKIRDMEWSRFYDSLESAEESGYETS
eukprot:snap_masked-scaffold_33-processed-gene-2.22-mRNA-1 protein AED:0.05 eAED:0.05 QI:0/-1/0/1/-1/1/1/0/302